MPSLACSNILHDNAFNTSYDYTVSFKYKMDTQGVTPVQNNGFGLFFIDGTQTSISGGGSGAGLGIVDALSYIPGVFAIIGFDVQGTFSQINSIAPFTTGNVGQIIPNIGMRAGSTYNFLGSPTLTDNSAFDYDVEHTIRLDIRNKFRTVKVSILKDKTYNLLATFDSSYLTDNFLLPSIAKFGISFSGDTVFTVKDITVNFTQG